MDSRLKAGMTDGVRVVFATNSSLADEVSEDGAIPGTEAPVAVRNVAARLVVTPPPSVIPGLEPGIQRPRVCAVNEPMCLQGSLTHAPKDFGRAGEGGGVGCSAGG